MIRQNNIPNPVMQPVTPQRQNEILVGFFNNSSLSDDKKQVARDIIHASNKYDNKNKLIQRIIFRKIVETDKIPPQVTTDEFMQIMYR